MNICHNRKCPNFTEEVKDHCKYFYNTSMIECVDYFNTIKCQTCQNFKPKISYEKFFKFCRENMKGDYVNRSTEDIELFEEYYEIQYRIGWLLRYCLENNISFNIPDREMNTIQKVYSYLLTRVKD